MHQPPRTAGHTECRYYIEQSEALGLEPITYRKDYRNNDRVVANSHEVAALIWDRIKGFMDEIEITKEKDSVKWQVGNGFRLEGKWRPLGLNECWRLCRYQPGGHFGTTHRATTTRHQQTLLHLTPYTTHHRTHS